MLHVAYFLLWVSSDIDYHGFFCFSFLNFPSNQEGSAFDFGELEEAIVLQGVKIRNDEAKTCMLLSPSPCISFLPLMTFDRYNQLSERERERERERGGGGGERERGV